MTRRIDWRNLLARAPLPMLALAAAYGVYKFNVLFVPVWVALVSAAAFELTYVALAVVDTQDRRRATVIAVSAVVVSVLYNTLSGLFHIRPALIEARPLWADVVLAILHGAPLAVVAYNISVLLLHSTPTATAPQVAPVPALVPLVLAREESFPVPQPQPAPDAPDARGECIDASTADAPMVCPNCGTSLDPARWRAARRWGRCAACKAQ